MAFIFFPGVTIWGEGEGSADAGRVARGVDGAKDIFGLFYSWVGVK